MTPQTVLCQVRQADVECGQLDVSTSSHSSVQCGVALMTFGLQLRKWASCCISEPESAGETERTDWHTVFYLEAHPPSSSIHLSVMGCCLATLHIVLTSSHNSTKVTVAAKSVISMSLNAHRDKDRERQRENVKTESLCFREQRSRDPSGGGSTKSTTKWGIHSLLLNLM